MTEGYKKPSLSGFNVMACWGHICAQTPHPVHVFFDVKLFIFIRPFFEVVWNSYDVRNMEWVIKILYMPEIIMSRFTD